MIGLQYNISKAVIVAANARRLDATATGGNTDYIVRDLAGANRPAGVPILVLGAADDAGSPDKLSEPARVTLYLSEDWTQFISFDFDETVHALDFMAGFTGWTIGCEESLAAGDLLAGLKSVVSDLEHGTTGRWKGNGSAKLRAAIALAERGQS